MNPMNSDTSKRMILPVAYLKTHLLIRMLALLVFGMGALTGLDLFVSGAGPIHPNGFLTQTAQAQFADAPSAFLSDDQGEFIEIAMDPPGAGEGEFLVSNFATARVFNNFLWRGYAFRPSRDVQVTGMYGGWGNPASCTATEFYGAIFEGILTDGEITSEDGAVPQVRMQSLVSSVRFDDQLEDPVPAEVFVPFENTITLQRGVLYILAQGSADRGVNCHVSASDLDVNNLIAGSPIVSEWLPAINKAFSFPDVGTPESVVNLNAERLSDAMPLLGLRYETDVELPGVTTGAGLAIDTDRAIVNGTLVNTGAAASSDETTLFVEYGTGSGLSGSDTRLEQITPSQLKGEATGVPISATLEDLEAGETYYFRMVAVNEAGRTSGDIESFVQTPDAGVSVISAEVSFGGTVIPNVQAVASGGTTSFQLFADPSFFLSQTVRGTCSGTVISGGSFDGTTFTTGAVPADTECTLQFEFFQLRPQITRVVPGTNSIDVEFEGPRVDEVPEGEEPDIVRHEYSFNGETWVSINAGDSEAAPFTIEGLVPGPEYRLRIRTILSRGGVEEPSISSDILPVVLFEDGDGTPGDPFIITNRFQLNSVRFLLDQNFELANDIVFDSEDFEEGGAFFNSGLLWEPIGSETDPFTGTLDGKGFAIDNLRSSRSLQDYIGLFAKVQGDEAGPVAVVKNLSVRGNISGYRYVGGIAGMISTDVQAEWLFYSGRVTGGNPIDTRVGGIAGVLASDLSHSGFDGNLVRSNGNKAGGLAGKLVDANISHSYVQGEVTGPSTSRGSFGGLVGYVQATDPVEISYSYFSGDLITGNNSIAGFEGVGGLVGRMDNDGDPANTLTFTQVYAAGQVSTGTEEDSNSGGLVGFDGGATINVDGAFWDQEGTGQDASGITGGTGTPIPLETTAQAKLLESYDAWGESGADIAEAGDVTVTDSPWILYNQASYPYLRSNTPDSIPGLDLATRFASGSNAIWGDAQTWTVFGCPAGESVTYPRSSLPDSDALVTLCDETSLNIEADRSVTVSRLIMGSETSVQILPFGTLTFSGEDLTSILPSGTSITVNSNANAFVQADKTLAVDEDASFTVKTDGYFLSLGTVTGVITHERVLSEPDRWLLMSSPVTETRFAAESTNDPLALLAPLFTRGFPGSDLPNAPARSANVLLYDESLSGDRSDRFAPPSTNELPAGKGFMVRTSSEKPVNGVMQEIAYPLTLSVSGSAPGFDDQNQYTFSVSYSASEPNDPESGWNLLGNPFAFGLNWAATGTSSNPAWINRQMLNGFIYLYDPETQRYQVSSSSAADNDPNLDVLFSPIISPFQGFWVKSNNSTNTEFQLGQVAFSFDRINNTLFKEPGSGSHRPLAASENSVLMRFSTPQTDSSYALVRFGEEFSATFGDQDAYFLTPLADTFAWLHSDKEGRATLVNSQPFVNEEALTVPLSLGGIIGEQLYEGAALLEWDLGEGTAELGGVYLVDHQEGKSIDMRAQRSYAFDIDRQGLAKMVMERDELQQAGTPVMKSAAVGDARFELFVDGAVSTGMAPPEVPDRTELLPNYPNPFNPSTTIQYTLADPGAVRLEVYTITGQRVAVLVDEAGQTAGRHSVVFDAGHLASGLYLYRLQAGSTIQTRKMMLIK